MSASYDVHGNFMVELPSDQENNDNEWESSSTMDDLDLITALDLIENMKRVEKTEVSVILERNEGMESEADDAQITKKSTLTTMDSSSQLKGDNSKRFPDLQDTDLDDLVQNSASKRTENATKIVVAVFSSKYY